jgi:hypothetical protein
MTVLGIVAVSLSRIESVPFHQFVPFVYGTKGVLFDLLKEIERGKHLFLSQSVQVYRKRIKSFEISASNLKASRHTPSFFSFTISF